MEQIDVVVLPTAHFSLQELQARRQVRMAASRKQAKTLSSALCSYEEVGLSPAVSLSYAASCSSGTSSSSSRHAAVGGAARGCGNAAAAAPGSSLKRSRSESDTSQTTNSRSRSRAATSSASRKRPSATAVGKVDTCGFESDEFDSCPVFRQVSGPRMTIRSVLWA